MFAAHNALPCSPIRRSLGAIRNRPFLIFWVGACISNIGNWTENAAQSWAVTSQTIGNPHQGFLVEILQFADFCPVLLLALIAGVISDRVNRKTWLITLQALAWALGGGLAIAAYLGRATPGVVIAFTFLEGIIWALNGPVFLSVVPSLVPRAELGPALALNSIQFNMARLCGPMLAAVLIGAVGIRGAFAFNACTFLPLLICLLVAIPNIPAPLRSRTTTVHHDIREGLKFVWTSPGTRRLTIMSVIFMFLAAPLQGLLPVFAQSVLKGGPMLFGLMLSATGMGSILGAFLLSWIPSYYPLFCFNQFGDVEEVMLRQGNVHSANDWRSVLEPVVSRYRGGKFPFYFRADAGFANPEVYEFLEAEGYEYAIRLPANDMLLREIAPLLTRPVGRPSNVPVVWYYDFQYQAQSWNRARRVVAKVEWHRGELFPRIGFIVTNLTRSAKRVVRFYNQRGTAEQWIKEGKNAVRWTRLSCHDFVDNQVRLLLFVLAYNMGNFLRQAVLPRSVRHWSLTTLREKLIKIGAKVVRHSRQVIFQMAEVAVPRELFRAILAKIESLRLATAATG